MPLHLALAGSARGRGGMPPIRDLIALPTLFRSSGTSPSLASSALRGGWDGVAAVEQPENEWHKSIRRRCRLQHKPNGEEDRGAALRFVDPRGVGWNGSLCSKRTTRSHMIFFRSWCIFMQGTELTWQRVLTGNTPRVHVLVDGNVLLVSEESVCR
ncbi:hypothetical protein ACQJBY_023707 [Aegilops geniculata]